MTLVNPSNKNWKYINTTNYGKYMGPFVMKNKNEGVMIYPSSQKVYKTTDGWQTIVDVPNVASGWGLSQVVTTTAGYCGFEGALKKLYFSTNGTSWSKVQDGAAGTNVLRAIKNKVIHFTGAVSGNLVSTNGGQTFSTIAFGMNIPGTFVDFVMLTEDTLVVAMSNKLYRSANGGTTWTTTSFPVVVNSIAVKNYNEFFITSTSTAHFTDDGGNTWQTKTYNINGGTQMYIGNNLFLMPNYKSTDNGLTWDYFLPQTLSSSIFFDIVFKDNSGFVGKQKGKVAFSTDRGKSFSYDVTLPTSFDIMAVGILNNGDYLAGDRYGQVLYSSDKGANWVKRNTNTIPNNAIKFSHSADDKVIVMSCTGQPLFSGDSGATFNIVTVGGGTHKQTVKPNGQIIDVVGWFNYTTYQNKGWELSRWTPGGIKTIIDTFLVANESLIDIHAVTDNIGYLLTYENTTKATRIYKTNNGFASGGNKLISSINPVNAGVTNYNPGKIKIHTFGTDTIILVGEGKNFYHYSYNGGQTFTYVSSPAFNTYPTLYPGLIRSHFFNPNEYILLLKNSGLYININPNNINTGINDLFSHSISTNDLKIYPNPCKSEINIPNMGKVDVSIFDVTGKKVFEKLKYFSATESLNIANLTDGLYILQTTSSGSIKTGRFIKGIK
jgi:photosystem II stability/assembly factor-like uncharacterized protein